MRSQLKETQLPNPYNISAFTDRAVDMMRKSQFSPARWFSTYLSSNEFSQVVDSLDPHTLGVYLIAKARDMLTIFPSASGQDMMNAASVGFSTMLRIKALDAAREETELLHGIEFPIKQWGKLQRSLAEFTPAESGSGSREHNEQFTSEVQTAWDEMTTATATLPDFLLSAIDWIGRVTGDPIVASHFANARQMGATRESLDKFSKADAHFYNISFTPALSPFNTIKQIIERPTSG